ncbi:Hypothetical predicted protein [Podarcis lilfordi]|uniref:Uncharacterized protein n=1 Tax=Podarcis lilfordi TaxID=74358 RepID=A0AA35P2D9_9SAUR|nr:Hypothetical predicted protein [Podarcis lilfordi]
MAAFVFEMVDSLDALVLQLLVGIFWKPGQYFQPQEEVGTQLCYWHSASYRLLRHRMVVALSKSTLHNDLLFLCFPSPKLHPFPIFTSFLPEESYRPLREPAYLNHIISAFSKISFALLLFISFLYHFIF